MCAGRSKGAGGDASLVEPAETLSQGDNWLFEGELDEAGEVYASAARINEQAACVTHGLAAVAAGRTCRSPVQPMPQTRTPRARELYVEALKQDPGAQCAIDGLAATAEQEGSARNDVAEWWTRIWEGKASWADLAWLVVAGFVAWVLLRWVLHLVWFQLTRTRNEGGKPIFGRVAVETKSATKDAEDDTLRLLLQESLSDLGVAAPDPGKDVSDTAFDAAAELVPAAQGAAILKALKGVRAYTSPGRFHHVGVSLQKAEGKAPYGVTIEITGRRRRPRARRWWSFAAGWREHGSAPQNRATHWAASVDDAIEWAAWFAVDYLLGGTTAQVRLPTRKVWNQAGSYTAFRLAVRDLAGISSTSLCRPSLSSRRDLKQRTHKSGCGAGRRFWLPPPMWGRSASTLQYGTFLRSRVERTRQRRWPR